MADGPAAFAGVPFDAAQFFAVFTSYNIAVWPAQIPLGLAGLGAVALAARGRPGAGRAISILLGGLWLWMGAVYHLGFFRSINPAAAVFGVLFLLEGVLLLAVGGWQGRLRIAWRPGIAGIAGAGMIAYALVVYPLVGYGLGHRYPAAPTLGVPCPTTILTLGLLAWAAPPRPWAVLAIPLAWSAVAVVAAVQLGVLEDLGLVVAGLVLCLLTMRPAAGLPPRLRALL
jgi:hypothetical protein